MFIPVTGVFSYVYPLTCEGAFLSFGIQSKVLGSCYDINVS